METIRMKIRGDGTKENMVLEMKVIHFTLGQRLRKTLSWFVFFLGFGVLTAFIPVIHFVTVPSFLLLALGTLFFVPLIKEKIHETSFVCPYCHKSTSLQRPSLSPPFRDSCPECRQILYVEPEP